MEDELGMEVVKKDIGMDPNFPDKKLPPVILAVLGADPQKKTVSNFVS